jgi:hypothetical protein
MDCAMMDDAMKLTEKHVIAAATEILDEARRLGYFIFRCHVQAGGSLALILCFKNRGTIRHVRQVGWA